MGGRCWEDKLVSLARREIQSNKSSPVAQRVFFLLLGRLHWLLQSSGLSEQENKQKKKAAIATLDYQISASEPFDSHPRPKATSFFSIQSVAAVGGEEAREMG